MANRAIRAGQTINLRARFLDDLEDPAPADNNVFVNIFDPNAENTTDISLAYVVSGEADYLGKGIYEYQFLVPSCGPDGIWTDSWNGILNCQTLSGVFNFEVSASGVIESVANQLFNNNIVQITLVSGIHPLDGSDPLEEEYFFEFLTTASPAYSSTRAVRLQIGSYIPNLFDDVIQQLIVEASLEANALTFVDTITNLKIFQHARRKYVTCLASKALLLNQRSGSLRSKTLGDLSVTYDSKGIEDTLRDLEECMGKWEPQIISGGGSRSLSQPQMVIKGACDPDRPVVGRLWLSTGNANFSSQHPAGNVKVKPIGSRRSLKLYKKRYW